MTHRSRGYVPPSQWDDGIPAAFVDYSLTGGQAHHQNDDTTSSYLSLRNGVNLGPWRLRNTSAWSYSNAGGNRFQSQSSWLSRDIRSMNSQLRIGDAWTAGDLFDSVAFRGFSSHPAKVCYPTASAASRRQFAASRTAMPGFLFRKMAMSFMKPGLPPGRLLLTICSPARKAAICK